MVSNMQLSEYEGGTAALLDKAEDTVWDVGGKEKVRSRQKEIDDRRLK